LKTILARYALVGGIALGASLLATPGAAQASLQLRMVISEVGTSNSATFNWDGKTTDDNDNPAIIVSQTIGDMRVFLTVASTNSPGDGTHAFLSIGSSTITNQDKNNGHTLSIAVSATDYSAPGTDGNPYLPYLTLESNSSGTLRSKASTTSASGSFTSYASATNHLFATDFAAPTINFALGGSTTAYSGQTERKPFVESRYSLTSIGLYTLSGGAVLSNEGGNTFMHAPEPSSLALAALGLVTVTVGRVLRRRRNGAV
jgi:hypothetical protein